MIIIFLSMLTFRTPCYRLSVVSHRNSTNYGYRPGRHACQTGAPRMEPWRRVDREVCGFKIFHSAIPPPTMRRTYLASPFIKNYTVHDVITIKRNFLDKAN